jgi:hypothetical protein
MKPNIRRTTAFTKEAAVAEILGGHATYPAARVSAVESLTWVLGQ